MRISKNLLRNMLLVCYSSFRMAIIAGIIQKGLGIGEKIGFPTLNIPYAGCLRGVFVGKVYLNGEWHLAVVHLGEKPTFNDFIPVCEAFLLDFYGGRTIQTMLKVDILEKIRDIRRFATPDELKQQITRDVEFVKSCYNRTYDQFSEENNSG